MKNKSAKIWEFNQHISNLHLSPQHQLPQVTHTFHALRKLLGNVYLRNALNIAEHTYPSLFQAPTAKQMRTALFWVTSCEISQKSAVLIYVYRLDSQINKHKPPTLCNTMNYQRFPVFLYIRNMDGKHVNL